MLSRAWCWFICWSNRILQRALCKAEGCLPCIYLWRRANSTKLAVIYGPESVLCFWQTTSWEQQGGRSWKSECGRTVHRHCCTWNMWSVSLIRAAWNRAVRKRPQAIPGCQLQHQVKRPQGQAHWEDKGINWSHSCCRYALCSDLYLRGKWSVLGVFVICYIPCIPWPALPSALTSPIKTKIDKRKRLFITDCSTETVSIWILWIYYLNPGPLASLAIWLWVNVCHLRTSIYLKAQMAVMIRRKVIERAHATCFPFRIHSYMYYSTP